MPDRLMAVQVGVAGAGNCGLIVPVVMVLIALTVDMLVNMLKRFVGVLMFVLLGEVQPHTDSHQPARYQQVRRQGFAEENDGQCRAEKRRNREICAGTRRTEVAQTDHKQGEACAVAGKPQ